MQQLANGTQGPVQVWGKIYDKPGAIPTSWRLINYAPNSPFVEYHSNICPEVLETIPESEREKEYKDATNYVLAHHVKTEERISMNDR